MHVILGVHPKPCGSRTHGRGGPPAQSPLAASPTAATLVQAPVPASVPAPLATSPTAETALLVTLSKPPAATRQRTCPARRRPCPCPVSSSQAMLCVLAHALCHFYGLHGSSLALILWLNGGLGPARHLEPCHTRYRVSTRYRVTQ